MGTDVDRDERIAIAAGTGFALPSEADLGAVLHAGRQLDVERLAAGQRHTLAGQSRRILEADLEPVVGVGALLRRPLAAEATERPATAATTGAPAQAAENPFEQVGNALLVVAELKGLAIGPAEAALRAAAAIVAARAPAIAEGHLGIALLVNFAPVVLGAFVLVGQDVIGAGDLAEALGRARVVLVLVRMQLLGELAIGLLDLGLARAARHAKL